MSCGSIVESIRNFVVKRKNLASDFTDKVFNFRRYLLMYLLSPELEMWFHRHLKNEPRLGISMKCRDRRMVAHLLTAIKKCIEIIEMRLGLVLEKDNIESNLVLLFVQL